MRAQLVDDNKVHILWQVPMQVLMLVSEVLFAVSGEWRETSDAEMFQSVYANFLQVTGYEFAFTQTAPSLKALDASIFLLTLPIGDCKRKIQKASRIFILPWQLLDSLRAWYSSP